MTDSKDAEIDEAKKEQERAKAERARLDAETAKLVAETEKLAAEKVKLDAEKDKLDAEKLLAKAKQALDEAQSPRLESLEWQKSLADAQKDAATSSEAALKARLIGEVTAGPHKGSVDFKDTAGKTEGALLAARAVRDAAQTIAARFGKDDTYKKMKLYVFQSAEFPRFQQLLIFRFRKALLWQAFTVAGVESQVPAGTEMAATVGLVSAGMDAFSKLLGFFKTDYSLGGLETDLDQSLLLYAISGALKDKAKEVHVANVFEPMAHSSSVDELAKELKDLWRSRAEAAGKIADLNAEIVLDEKAAGGEVDEEKKRTLLQGVEDIKGKVDLLKAAIALYDELFASLTTQPQDKAAMPLESLALEHSLDKALKQESIVMLVRLERSGGGYFIKKNLWTGLGAMPLYYMGGATVSYLLLDGPTGKVLDGDTVPLHGGFVKANDLKSTINAGQ